MSSIFSKISKINKQKLDKIESELYIIRQAIFKIESEISEIYRYIDNLVIPQNGGIKLLNSFQESRRVLNTQKDMFKSDLQVKNLELSRKQHEYKEAKLEYEKIKYLEEEEIAKRLEKLKKDEAKELDEISNQLFKRSGH